MRVLVLFLLIAASALADPNPPSFPESFMTGMLLDKANFDLSTEGLGNFVGGVLRSTALKADLIIVNATDLTIYVLKTYTTGLQFSYIPSLSRCDVTNITDTQDPMFDWLGVSHYVDTEPASGQLCNVFEFYQPDQMRLRLHATEAAPVVPALLQVQLTAKQTGTVGAFVAAHFFNFTAQSPPSEVFTIPSFCKKDSISEPSVLGTMAHPLKLVTETLNSLRLVTETLKMVK